MAIRQVKKEPELPPAHLYLEDVEEIVTIMTAATKNHPLFTDASVRFEIGQRECDSIEDLKRLGGSVRQFTIRVGSNQFSVSRFATYCSRDGGVFDGVLKLMTAREMKLKAAGHKLLPLLAIVSFLFAGLLASFLDWTKKTGHNGYGALFLCAAISWFTVTAWVAFTNSVVELRYSFEPSPRVKISKEWASRAVWIVLTVFLTLAAQWLWQHFTKK